MPRFSKRSNLGGAALAFLRPSLLSHFTTTIKNQRQEAQVHVASLCLIHGDAESCSAIGVCTNEGKARAEGFQGYDVRGRSGSSLNCQTADL